MYQVHKRILSDFQVFLVANLSAQAKVQSQLTKLEADQVATDPKNIASQRIAQLRTDLVALNVVMNMRCR